METITRNVSEIDSTDRRAFKHMVGHNLSDDQRVVIRVESTADPTEEPMPAIGSLPVWCDIYEGSSDEEIDALSESIVRTLINRTFD